MARWGGAGGGGLRAFGGSAVPLAPVAARWRSALAYWLPAAAAGAVCHGLLAQKRKLLRRCMKSDGVPAAPLAVRALIALLPCAWPV